MRCGEAGGMTPGFGAGVVRLGGHDTARVSTSYIRDSRQLSIQAADASDVSMRHPQRVALQVRVISVIACAAS